MLAEWHWRKNFTEMFGEALVDTLADATVRSPQWLEMDRGALSEAEMVELLARNAPQHAKEVERIVRENHTFVTTYPYADAWLRGLRNAGYKVYILSNFGDFSYNRAKPGFTFLQYADGALISYEVKLVKPDRAIYEALCTRFGHRSRKRRVSRRQAGKHGSRQRAFGNARRSRWNQGAADAARARSA